MYDFENLEGILYDQTTKSGATPESAQLTSNPKYIIFAIHKLFLRTLISNFPKTSSHIKHCVVDQITLHSISKFQGFSSIKTDKSPTWFSYIKKYLVATTFGSVTLPLTRSPYTMYVI